ncbi:MAG: polyprenol monophosphomannose synthase [Deltaproteobacteria bacterium]|nr:polyprenol monophosphomannose synthase [Deltaproteobacteria bacterium]
MGKGALVCVPTYNERENLEHILPAIFEQVPAAHVLVIDDSSPDGTGEIADRLAADDVRIHVLHREAKQGLGRAYIAGFGWALARDYLFVIEFDADFSHDPAYLPEMLERLCEADVVVGSRRVPGGGVENWGVARRLVSSAGSLYSRALLGVHVRDLTGGFNGFRRAALESLDLDAIAASGFAFQIEIKYRAVRSGLNVVEMPIVFRDRAAGTSKMSAAIFAEAMLGVLKLRLADLLSAAS